MILESKLVAKAKKKKKKKARFFILALPLDREIKLINLY